MSGPNQSKPKRAHDKAPGEGSKKSQRHDSHAIGLSAQNILQCSSAERAGAALRLKRQGVNADSPDYERRLKEVISDMRRGIQSAKMDRERERQAREEFIRRSDEHRRLLMVCESERDRTGKLKPLSKDAREQLLARLDDKKQRPGLIEALVREGKCAATEECRKAANDMLDQKAEAIRETLHLTVKDIIKRHAELVKEMRKLRDKASPEVCTVDRGYLAAHFHYDIADDIAASARIDNEQPGHRARPHQYMSAVATVEHDATTGEERPDGDRYHLFILLRLVGEWCANPANKAWLEAVTKLRRLSKGKVASFEQILVQMIGALAVDEDNANLARVPGFVKGGGLKFHDKFRAAVVKLIWQITDSARVCRRRKETSKALEVKVRNKLELIGFSWDEIALALWERGLVDAELEPWESKPGKLEIERIAGAQRTAASRAHKKSMR